MKTSAKKELFYIFIIKTSLQNKNIYKNIFDKDSEEVKKYKNYLIKLSKLIIIPN